MVSGCNFEEEKHCILSERFFTFANSVDHDEMQHIILHFILVFTVCKINSFRVSQIQRVKYILSTFCLIIKLLMVKVYVLAQRRL